MQRERETDDNDPELRAAKARLTDAGVDRDTVHTWSRADVLSFAALGIDVLRLLVTRSVRMSVALLQPGVRRRRLGGARVQLSLKDLKSKSVQKPATSMGRKQDLENENERLRGEVKAFERAVGCYASELDSDDVNCVVEGRERIVELEAEVENLKEEVTALEEQLRCTRGRKYWYKEELATLRDTQEAHAARMGEKRQRYKRQRLLRRDTEAIAQWCRGGGGGDAGAAFPRLWYPDDPANRTLFAALCDCPPDK